ncbi:hypothetical protein KN815_21235 [Streptomyces sp. 4503]|uniref:Integral membrane protein n=1 Tax=Streptomyces niphimycinicus TaxID=2842201 RepID=A0ABS6CHU2_9ACTN|nr:hypothetical protein [Streptomyces niphimycinicus]MBU3866497.1 hypothetical protein [Streptomyces niphimycinicus]
MNVLQVLAAIAVVIFVIARQLRGEPLRGKRLILLPAVLAIVGFTSLGKGGRHLTTTDLACLVISAVIAAGIGTAQGALLRLEPRDGVLWARMPVYGLWLWLALVVSRVVMTVVAVALHAHVAGSSAPILVLLGLNRLGQAAVVTPRALASGVPFAPEKDGRPFDVRGALAGLLGGSGDTPGPDAERPTGQPRPPRYSRPTASYDRSARDLLRDRRRRGRR